MVAIGIDWGNFIANAPYLGLVHSREKLLPPNYINEAGNMPTQAFSDYALPLIGDVPPLVRLNALRVAKR